jgi:hypothetical protein
MVRKVDFLPWTGASVFPREASRAEGMARAVARTVARRSILPLPDDYLQPDAYGAPHKQDGTDTFGYYHNGAVFAGHTTEFLAAHYVAGETEYLPTAFFAQ